jgi:hypothetical protein
MLNAIKSIINRKEEFLESAQIIYEDAVNDVEDRIIDTEGQPATTDNINENVPSTDEPKNINETDDNEPDDVDDGDGLDIMNMDINNPNAITPGDSAIFDMKLSDDKSPVDDDSDILSMTIDIKTNTLIDVLPVPPLNAGDAVSENIMSTKVEDGFTEAINIDASADDGNGKPAGDNTTDNKIDDEPEKDTNPVTDAVIDKVNDANTTPAPADTDDDAKSKLLDKLDKLNKSIVNMKEDIKKYIS